METVQHLLRELHQSLDQLTDGAQYSGLTVCAPSEVVAELLDPATFATLLTESKACVVHVKPLDKLNDVVLCWSPTPDTLKGLELLVSPKASLEALTQSLITQLEGTKPNMKAFKAGKKDSIQIFLTGGTPLLLTKENVTTSLKYTRKRKKFASSGLVGCL